MKVSELAETEGFRAIALPEPGREIEGCYIGDLLSWVMGRAREGNAWVTIMSNINIEAVASLADVSCVILAEGVEPDAQVCETALAKGINLITAGLPAYEVAVKLSGMI